MKRVRTSAFGAAILLSCLPVLGRAQLRHDVEAGNAGEHHVEQHEIDRGRARVGEARERSLAALGHLDAVAVGLQVEGQAAREMLLVLND